MKGTKLASLNGFGFKFFLWLYTKTRMDREEVLKMIEEAEET